MTKKITMKTTTKERIIKSFIHYGADSYNIAKFRDITNNPYMPVKPFGGLWVSPIDSKFGWKDFCIQDHYSIDSLDKYFIIQLIPFTKVYTIDTYKELATLPRIKGTYNVDFEAIAKKYQAIYLTEEGQRTTRYTRPMNLYGWDCESILILDKFCFKVIEESYGK